MQFVCKTGKVYTSRFLPTVPSLFIVLKEEIQSLQAKESKIRDTLHHQQKGKTDSLISFLRVAEKDDPIKARDIRLELMHLRTQVENDEQLKTLRGQIEELNNQIRSKIEGIMIQDPECRNFFSAEN